MGCDFRHLCDTASESRTVLTLSNPLHKQNLPGTFCPLSRVLRDSMSLIQHDVSVSIQRDTVQATLGSARVFFAHTHTINCWSDSLSTLLLPQLSASNFCLEDKSLFIYWLIDCLSFKSTKASPVFRHDTGLKYITLQLLSMISVTVWLEMGSASVLVTQVSSLWPKGWFCGFIWTVLECNSKYFTGQEKETRSWPTNMIIKTMWQSITRFAFPEGYTGAHEAQINDW